MVDSSGLRSMKLTGRNFHENPKGQRMRRKDLYKKQIEERISIGSSLLKQHTMRNTDDDEMRGAGVMSAGFPEDSLMLRP